MTRAVRIAGWALLSAALLPAGCAAPPPPLWRAGARVSDRELLGVPKRPSEVQVYFKREFGLLERRRARRHFACATTTVLRKAYPVRVADKPAPPDRGYTVLARITTEEFPRDEAESELRRATFSSWFGFGDDPFDLFDVRLDPAFLEDALARLRGYAARLGADAVIEVYATGEAEHHMWLGEAINLDARETSSPIHIDGRLLDFRLRDARLQGLAVKYD